MNMKTVVITSGGMDSAVLLAHLKKEGYEARALSINYGQRHRHELQFASVQAALLGVPHIVVDMCSLKMALPGSSQTDNKVPVPHGHYAAENMKLTVVPNRNMILLAVAIGHAIAHECDSVAYGAHAGDHAIYPDCRPAFADAMRVAASLCDYRPIQLLRPFIDKTKAEIVRLGAEVGVDFSMTYSCYEGDTTHCGRCGTCVERILAFREAHVPDPTNYKDTSLALSLEGL